MRFGIHMPLKGGFEKNVDRCREIGCRTVQIFAGNPTAWAPPRLNTREIGFRKALLSRAGLRPLLIHTAYLINLASPNPEFYRKSLSLFRDTMERAFLYGAPFVVLHTGNHGNGGREEGLVRLVETLKKEVPTWAEGTMLLLENTAGGGSALGSRLEELGEILRCFSPNDPLGICLDTAHAWAAGYNLSQKEGVNKTLDILDREVGLERVKAVHANDSAVPLGSQKDRHAHIGRGEIGLAGFAALLQAPWPRDFPVILETPAIGSDFDRQNLAALEEARKG